LSATDRAALGLIFNKNGTASTGNTTYNVDAADDWNTVITGGDIADATGNGVDISNVTAPAITSATYNAGTGVLVVTGTNFVRSGTAADGNDITANKLTLTGEGGDTYTLTDTANVDVTSATSFSLTLSATDQAGVNLILNKAGSASTNNTTYNLGAETSWAAGDSSNGSDTTGNGVTVSNIAAPAITSSTYNATTGTLILTGTGFLRADGATNDIVANKFTFTGEGGDTYTLTDTSNVEATSGTSATLTLSATDRAAVNLILNKNGTASTGNTTYNLEAAEDWNAGAEASVNIADATTEVTVSSVAQATVTSATYDYTTNTLVVTGTNFVKRGGANDVDLTKLTLTGENGAQYTLATSTDVEITDGTSFSVTLTGADLQNVEALLNKDGTNSATAGTLYNLAAQIGFLRGDSNDAGDATNGVTVFNWAAPTITSTTFDWSTGELVLTGTNFVVADGVTNDIVASKLTFTGEGGSYILTDTSNVEITSATSATITLSATDLMNVRGLLNKNLTQSSGGTAYNLAAADDWMAGSPVGNDVSDATTGVTVSNVGTPSITEATYDSDSGVLTVSGTNLFKMVGASNDIDISTLTLAGQGNVSYTITSASDVEITSATSFTVTLTGADKTNVDALLNRTGSVSEDDTPYNLAVADDWLGAADPASDIADATNAVTVSINPKIISAVYNSDTGVLTVTGANMQANGGGADIDVSKLTLTGEGGQTYTLTSADVEIDSATQFTVTLNATDKAALGPDINRNGATSTGGTTYNIAADDDWNTNVTVGDTSDATGNGVTVLAVAVPAITSATYDAATGTLVVTGTDFRALSGAANDIDVSKLTLTGEGGETYTLTGSSVEITDGTSFTVTLNATDLAGVNQILNNTGLTATGGATYNLVAAEDWAAGTLASIDVADLTGNAVTLSHPTTPTITSATYDYATGTLVVTGTGLLKRDGAANDIVANTFTVTGANGGQYRLTDTANVDITSATSFTLILSATDKAGVNALTDASGSASLDLTSYNLGADENWNAGAATAVTIADTANNAVTASNVPGPSITSATYDAATGLLVVTAVNVQSKSGADNDIDASLFTFTGEGGQTYTLTDSSDVERTSTSAFTITLSAADKAAVNQIMNRAGTSSTGGTTYNIAAADDWNANLTDGDTADATSPVTLDNPTTPTITSATYDAASGTLVVTGTGFLKLSGATNDIDVTKLTLTGEGGDTYTLTSNGVEITSGTAFTINLNAADKAALNLILNKDGTASTGSTTYNLAGAEDWAAGAASAVNVADLTGNGVTVSGVAAPTVTSAAYDYDTGVLTVTGTGFLKAAGATNDIDLTKLTLTGKAVGTYTLTSADVEITSATTFTVTLNADDKAALNALLDTNGTTSGGVTYNLAAAGNWNRGAAGAAADLTDNGVTVSGVPAPVVITPSSTTTTTTSSTTTTTGNTGTGTGATGDTAPPAALVTVVRDNATTTTTTTAVEAPAPAAPAAEAQGGQGTGQTANVGAATVQTVPAALTAPAANAFQVSVAVRAAGGGDALVVNAPMQDTVVTEGNRISVTVPAEAFAHTRADATVTLTATRGDGAALPGWMNFNPQTGTFEGTPPPGFRGEVVVKVVARDRDGRQAVQTFKIVVGQGAGNIAPRGGDGQGRPQGGDQGQPQGGQPQDGGQGPGQPAPAPGQTGDAGHGDAPKAAKAVGRPSLTQQLRELSQEGRIAKQAALLNALKHGGKAA